MSLLSNLEREKMVHHFLIVSSNLTVFIQSIRMYLYEGYLTRHSQIRGDIRDRNAENFFCDDSGSWKELLKFMII